MNLIISIKPQFVSKIISKEKNMNLERIFLKNLLKKFLFILLFLIKRLWDILNVIKLLRILRIIYGIIFQKMQGFLNKIFLNIFWKKKRDFAMEISKLTLFNNPIDVDDICGFVAPQSFKYVDYDF